MPGSELDPATGAANAGARPVRPVVRSFAHSPELQDLLDRVCEPGGGMALRLMGRRRCSLLRCRYVLRLPCCMVRQWTLGADSPLTAQRERCANGVEEGLWRASSGSRPSSLRTSHWCACAPRTGTRA